MRAVVSYKELPQVLASRTACLLRRSQCQTPGGASAALADGRERWQGRANRQIIALYPFTAILCIGRHTTFGEMSAPAGELHSPGHRIHIKSKRWPNLQSWFYPHRAQTYPAEPTAAFFSPVPSVFYTPSELKLALR